MCVVSEMNIFIKNCIKQAQASKQGNAIKQANTMKQARVSVVNNYLVCFSLLHITCF